MRSTDNYRMTVVALCAIIFVLSVVVWLMATDRQIEGYLGNTVEIKEGLCQ